MHFSIGLALRGEAEQCFSENKRRLTQPAVSKHAALAAFVTALLCYPRFLLWNQRMQPVWYLEAVIFCGGFVLWAFVFAWHTQYTQRPVFALQIHWREWAVTTAAGLVMASVLYVFLDPSLRRTTPEDYPTHELQWAAMTLFSLALNQLLLVFAPFAWLVRLFGRPTIALILTIVFGVIVIGLKTRMSPAPHPASLVATLLGSRLLLSLLSVTFYLRGGVLLASWFALLVQARLLPGLLSIASPHDV